MTLFWAAGNAKLCKVLPPKCRAGNNANAFVGGFRLWEDVAEQSAPAAVSIAPGRPAAANPVATKRRRPDDLETLVSMSRRRTYMPPDTNRKCESADSDAVDRSHDLIVEIEGACNRIYGLVRQTPVARLTRIACASIYARLRQAGAASSHGFLQAARSD